jgi:adenine-specific DNA-methyltransferase
VAKSATATKKRAKAIKPPKAAKKRVATLRHTEDKRLNIPTAEHQSVLEPEHLARREVRYPRNTDLDPQLVWRGKDYQDWSDLVVQAPPLYIQEKVHPKALIDDLLRQSKEARAEKPEAQIDLFADFNGVEASADRTDFYQHDQNWTNRMILGDSLQVMASLAEREGLRGKVQCIYIDPPYGIKFNSNFQWSTTDRNPKDGKADHITREPEQVKAFRDTWRDGIHSYLTYLRDRLSVARDLLAGSGSIFVQIGDENLHRVRAVMDEVFGEDNFVSVISFAKTTGLARIIHEGADFSDSAGDRSVKPRCQGDREAAEACATGNLTRPASATRPRPQLRPGETDRRRRGWWLARASAERERDVAPGVEVGRRRR